MASTPFSRYSTHARTGLTRHTVIDHRHAHITRSCVQVPQEPYLCGGIALCFYGLSCLSTVMERILLFPEPLPSVLVKRVMWILNTPQDTARYLRALLSAQLPTWRETGGADVACRGVSKR